jgi:hypothetical protein
MKQFYVLIFTFIAVLFCNDNLIAQTKGSFAMTYNNSGVTNTIYFYVPTNYDSTKTYPMLFGFHGSGMPGSNMRDLLNIGISNKVDVIICCPDINNITSDGTRLNTLINASLSYTRSTYKIDSNKIIATGFSMGGGIAYQLGLINPTLFKGIIGISHAIGSTQFSQTMWDNIKKIRIATIDGTLDFNYTVVKGMISDITNKGGSILYIEKVGMDHTGTNGYFNTQEFKDDYLKCYNYVLNLSTDVEDNPNISKIGFNISPNPVSDFLTINKNQEIEKIEIFSAIGLKVIETEWQEKINVRNLPEGIYFLIIKSENFTETKKFVIIR